MNFCKKAKNLLVTFSSETFLAFQKNSSIATIKETNRPTAKTKNIPPILEKSNLLDQSFFFSSLKSHWLLLFVLNCLDKKTT